MTIDEIKAGIQAESAKNGNLINRVEVEDASSTLSIDVWVEKAFFLDANHKSDGSPLGTEHLHVYPMSVFKYLRGGRSFSLIPQEILKRVQGNIASYRDQLRAAEMAQ